MAIEINMTTMGGSKKGWVRSRNRGFADARTLHLCGSGTGETRCRDSVNEVLEVDKVEESTNQVVCSPGCTPRLLFQRPGYGNSSSKAPHWSRLAIRLSISVDPGSTAFIEGPDGSAYELNTPPGTRPGGNKRRAAGLWKNRSRCLPGLPIKL